LFEPYPLESTLHVNLHNHFNSAIVAKSISSKMDGVDWLTWTFMYRRLVNNPNFYNMDDTSEQSISLYLSDLIDETAEYLTSIKCIENDEEAEE
jgi:pre-mRNA-splicing helicase BRR2